MLAGCTSGGDDTAPTSASISVDRVGSTSAATTDDVAPPEPTTAPSTTAAAPTVPPAPAIAALTIEPVFDLPDRWLGSAWSPDGASIVALQGLPDPQGSTFSIVRMDTTGNVQQQLPFEHRFIGRLPRIVGPDGSELLLADGSSGCTMQAFDAAGFTLGSPTALPSGVCSGERYDWDPAVAGIVWAADPLGRVLHRLDATAGADTEIPLNTVVGPDYQISWMVLHGGAVFVSFAANPEAPAGPDGTPLPDLVVRVDQATLVPEGSQAFDGRVGATGGRMVQLGSAGTIVAELDPVTLLPFVEATAASRPPVAWGAVDVDDTVAWTAGLDGETIQVLQRNPTTTRVVATGQVQAGLANPFNDLWRFVVGRDLYVLVSPGGNGAVGSRMWRVAPSPAARLVADVQITGEPTTTTTIPPTSPVPLTVGRLPDIAATTNAAASPDGASIIAVTTDRTQTPAVSSLLKIDAAGAVTHNVPLGPWESVSQVVVTPSATWIMSGCPAAPTVPPVASSSSTPRRWSSARRSPCRQA